MRARSQNFISIATHNKSLSAHYYIERNNHYKLRCTTTKAVERYGASMPFRAQPSLCDVSLELHAVNAALWAATAKTRRASTYTMMCEQDIVDAILLSPAIRVKPQL